MNDNVIVAEGESYIDFPLDFSVMLLIESKILKMTSICFEG